MATVPVETGYDPLRPPGAVMVQRDGVAAVGHYGSVSAEIAVSTKAAGLIDRSGIRQLALTGPAAQLEHVLDAAAPGSVPGAGEPSASAAPGAAAARRGGDRRRRAERHRALAPGREPGDLHRRARGDRRAAARVGCALAGRPAQRRIVERRRTARGPGGRRGRRRAPGGRPVTVVREDGDHFLLLFEHGHPSAVWQALCEAGQSTGWLPWATRRSSCSRRRTGRPTERPGLQLPVKGGANLLGR